MKTKLQEVTTLIRQWVCDQNGCEGYMQRDQTTGVMVMTDPPKIPYICNGCARQDWHTEMFPAMCTKEVEYDRFLVLPYEVMGYAAGVYPIEQVWRKNDQIDAVLVEFYEADTVVTTPIELAERSVKLEVVAPPCEFKDSADYQENGDGYLWHEDVNIIERPRTENKSFPLLYKGSNVGLLGTVTAYPGDVMLYSPALFLKD